MADQKIELTVRVNSDTGGIDVLGSKLKTLGDTAKGTESSFLGLSGTSADLAKQFLPFVTVVGGATFAISKLTGFITDSIKESEDFRQTLTRMRSALETTGGSWDKSGKAIEDWAQAIQLSTRFSDNQALASLDRLTRATGNLAIAQKATTLAMDISVKTGRDFNTTTDIVTRLILGQNRALLEAQKEFGNVLSGAKDTKEALEKLSVAYEGAAIAERSLTSESSKLRNEWDDLKKNVGNAISPALLTLTETLNGLFPSLAKVGVVLKSYFTKGAIGSIIDFKDISKAFSQIDEEAKKAAKSVEDLKNGSGGLADALKNYKPPKIGGDKSDSGGESDADKLAREKAASNERLLAMEDDLNVRMAQLDDNSLQGKLNVLKAEETAELNKVAKEKGAEENKEKVVAQIRGVYRKKEEAALKADAKMKATMAMQAADVAVQALQTIDSMGEVNSKSDARRAKLFLALRQSMAIANAWVSALDPQTPGPIWAKVAMAAATTGLVVAQFAAQSKGIDKARAANEQEASSTSISTDYGNGTTITDTFGGSSSGSTTSGGISSLGSSGGGSSGGGGGSTIINVGGVTVQFTADSVDLSSVEVIARRLGEEVLRRTTEGVHLAVAIRNVGEANKNLAV